MNSYKEILFVPLLLLFCVACNSQDQGMVSGTVIDANGMAVAGVELIVKGTDIKTTTDENGKYFIAAQHKAVLLVSLPSYGEEEIKVKDRELNFMMTEEGFKTRYWCCTSHEDVTHCDLKKSILKETHDPEEEFTRF